MIAVFYFSRVIEAFTRPHYQVTAMDELYQASAVILACFLFVGILVVATRGK